MKKILSIVLAIVVSSGAFATLSGCAKEDPAKTLYIEVENAGFGIAWLDPLIEIFEAEHPGITVKKTFLTKKGNEMIDKVVSGSTHLDLLFVETDYALRNVDKKVVSGGMTYSSPYAELTDIYESNVPGESVTLKDKMLPAYSDAKKTIVNGETKYFTMPWMQAPVGIIINNEVPKITLLFTLWVNEHAIKIAAPITININPKFFKKPFMSVYFIVIIFPT